MPQECRTHLVGHSGKDACDEVRLIGQQVRRALFVHQRLCPGRFKKYRQDSCTHMKATIVHVAKKSNDL